MLVLWLVAFFATGGCQPTSDDEPGGDSDSSLVSRAQKFRALVAEGDYTAARAMMALDARRWWDAREGEGQPWTVGDTVRGPWANWDDYYSSTKEIIFGSFSIDGSRQRAASPLSSFG